VIALAAHSEPRDYRLFVPAGHYRSLRVDPATLGGRYAIEGIEIRTTDDRTLMTVPLASLLASHQATLVERGTDRIVIDVPPGPADPQLEYRPDAGVVLPSAFFNSRVLTVLGKLIGLWIAGIAAVTAIGWIYRRVRPAREAFARMVLGAQRHPLLSVGLVAAIATLVSTYPLVFLGRSLVTPNNNALPMLYDTAPFLPGSTDVVFEDVRGSDASATIIQGVPHTSVERLALGEGELPLWNRFNASGRPLWGQGLAFVLDPLHWPTLLGAEPGFGWDIKFIAHRLVFALGIGLLSLAATGALGPALIVTAASVFGGIYSFRFNHPALFALTYAPWALLAWVRLAQYAENRWRALAALGLSVSTALVLVAATPKEAAIMLLGVHSAGFLTLMFVATSARSRWSGLVWAGGAGLAAVLLTMPHWLVFFETLSESFTVYDKPYAILAGRSEAVGFFLTPLSPGRVEPGLHLLAMVLLGAAASAPKRLWQFPVVRAAAAVSFGLVATAFGAVPVSVLVKLPLIGNIGHINDAFLTAALPLLLVVCAFGANVLLTATSLRAAFVTGLVAIALAALAFQVQQLASAPGFEPLAVLAIAPLALALPVSLRLVGVVGPTLGGCTTMTGAALTLLLPSGLHVESGISAIDRLLLQPRYRTVMDRDSSAVETIHRVAKEPARTIGVDWALFSGSQALYQLEGIGGADPLELPAYRELVDSAGIWRDWGWFTMVRQADLVRLAPLLDMLNVGYVLSRPDNVPEGLSAIDMSRADRLVVSGRPTAWPRAFYVDGVVSYDGVADLLKAVASSPRPVAAVQSSDPHAREATAFLAPPSGRFVPARAYRLTANSTSFAIQTDAPGVAVLSETFLDGDFRATLNGAPVPYFRVNHAFKGLVIPAGGDWTVRFEYRPEYWGLSLLASACGAAMLIVMALMGSGRGRSVASGLAIPNRSRM
jgi:hypothetical protein